MKSLRVGLSLAIMLVFATVMGSQSAVASSNVCIARYGTIVTQQGTAQCGADSTSVAIARGDGSSAYANDNSTATASGSNSQAGASYGSNATVNGASSFAYAVYGSTAIVNGYGNFAIAGSGNQATVNGNHSSAQAFGCPVTVNGNDKYDSC